MFDVGFGIDTLSLRSFNEGFQVTVGHVKMFLRLSERHIKMIYFTLEDSLSLRCNAKEEPGLIFEFCSWRLEHQDL
jgi:hypothetical protein